MVEGGTPQVACSAFPFVRSRLHPGVRPRTDRGGIRRPVAPSPRCPDVATSCRRPATSTPPGRCSWSRPMASDTRSARISCRSGCDGSEASRARKAPSAPLLRSGGPGGRRCRRARAALPPRVRSPVQRPQLPRRRRRGGGRAGEGAAPSLSHRGRPSKRSGQGPESHGMQVPADSLPLSPRRSSLRRRAVVLSRRVVDARQSAGNRMVPTPRHM